MVELKRDRTPRDVVAQALEYAAFAAKLAIRYSAWVAMRNTWAVRLVAGPVFELMILPPVILFCGQRFNQDAKCAASGKRDISAPISANKVKRGALADAGNKGQVGTEQPRAVAAQDERFGFRCTRGAGRLIFGGWLRGTGGASGGSVGRFRGRLQGADRSLDLLITHVDELLVVGMGLPRLLQGEQMLGAPVTLQCLDQGGAAGFDPAIS